MAIFDRIDELIKERGITAKQLSQDIGVSPGNITDWKNGKSKPSAEAITKIADYFNVSADYLLGRSDIRYSGERAAASSDIPYDQLPPEALEELERYKQYLISQFGKKKQE